MFNCFANDLSKTIKIIFQTQHFFIYIQIHRFGFFSPRNVDINCIRKGIELTFILTPIEFARSRMERDKVKNLNLINGHTNTLERK